MNIYSPTNYRQNLIEYWRQWYPEWDIPKGYHVHHIIPQSCGGSNHPRNLIALHPDDHIAIHKHRGDKFVNNFFYMNRSGISRSKETREKISKTLTGYKQTKQHRENVRKGREGFKQPEWFSEFISKTNTGRKMSQEAKKKISKGNSGKKRSKEYIDALKERNGNTTYVDGVRYPSMNEAAKHYAIILNCSVSTARRKIESMQKYD